MIFAFYYSENKQILFLIVLLCVAAGISILRADKTVFHNNLLIKIVRFQANIWQPGSGNRVSILPSFSD